MVEQFDCFAWADEKGEQSLRKWQSGGPNGAAWNADGAPLRCVISLRVPCAGSTVLSVFGNQHALASQTWRLKPGTNELTLQLAARRWEAALSKGARPQSLLALSVSGLVNCEDPELGGGYPFIDALLAGFASGE